MLAIETSGLSKRLGGRTVVDGVDLAVPAGAVYGFLGPNGAGKTTVMRLLLGLFRPDAGHVRLLGHAMPGERIAALAQVGAFIESPGLYEHLSGRANLDLARRLRGLPPGETDRVLELVDLDAVAARRRAGAYSLGMKQRLALGRALLGNPRLLLLDEPTNGLDPDGIIAVRELIRALPERAGCTVFVSSHLLAEVEQMATHMGMMRAGKLAVQSVVAELLGSARHVRIVADDPARALAVLAEGGLEAEMDGDAVRLACPADTIRDGASTANRLLVSAGLAVSHLAPEPRTLEGLYRETVAAGQELAA